LSNKKPFSEGLHKDSNHHSDVNAFISDVRITKSKSVPIETAELQQSGEQYHLARVCSGTD